MKFIGNRISYQEKNGVFSVVIAASVERFKEALLAAWLIAWTLCGSYFIYQLFGPLHREAKLYIFILLVFWAYYEYRITRIFLWRKYGYESIRMKDDKVYIRNVIRGRGKTQEFFIENIEAFVRLNLESFWLKTMDNSFWVMGNEYISFTSQGKNVSFGRQLAPDEAAQLVVLLNRQLTDRKRRLKTGK